MYKINFNKIDKVREFRTRSREKLEDKWRELDIWIEKEITALKEKNKDKIEREQLEDKEFQKTMEEYFKKYDELKTEEQEIFKELLNS